MLNGDLQRDNRCAQSSSCSSSSRHFAKVWTANDVTCGTAVPKLLRLLRAKQPSSLFTGTFASSMSEAQHSYGSLARPHDMFFHLGEIGCAGG
jgi:hypothetical protein